MDFKNKTPRRNWTPKEEKTLYHLSQRKYTIQQISTILNRSPASIKNKLRRIKKKQGNGHYNKDHHTTKSIINQRFLKQTKPETILDLYNGGNQQYKKYNTTTNDINTEYNTNYHEDAQTLIKKLYKQGNRYDLIDLDPYGSAYNLLQYAIPMTNKALIITIGELIHKRFKRLDYVQKKYNIQRLQDFTLTNINRHIIGYAEKKHNTILNPLYVCDWKYIGRIYYTVTPPIKE